MKSATQVLIGILIFLCTVFAANAQLLELQVENVKRDSFPKYTGELVVRNPAGIDLDKISFFEGDSVIDINFEAGSQSESKYSGKEVATQLRVEA